MSKWDKLALLRDSKGKGPCAPNTSIRFPGAYALFPGHAACSPGSGEDAVALGRVLALIRKSQIISHTTRMLLQTPFIPFSHLILVHSY